MKKIAFVMLALILVTGSAPADEIHKAVKNNDLNRVIALKAKDPRQVNLPDRMGMTPLHYAACFGRHKVAVYLISNGAQLDARDTTFGFTPLHMACTRDIAALLVKQGASINSRDNMGATPLFAAVTNGRKDVVEVLLSHNADVNASTSYGMTPLKKAMVLYNDRNTQGALRSNLSEIIIILRKNGAKE